MEEKPTFDTGEAPARHPSPGGRKPHTLRPLQNFWYFALPSAGLERGKMKAIKLSSQNILLGRTNDGKVFAMKDLCPHRSTPLHHGKFDGEEVQCHYHGWKFAPDGRCTLIPALCAPQEHFGDRVRNGTFPCREGQGVIWVFIGDRDRENLPELPLVPDPGLLRHPLPAELGPYGLHFLRSRACGIRPFLAIHPAEVAHHSQQGKGDDASGPGLGGEAPPGAAG
jgi:nitrite reductase/ring-hydroxylating ferredoxin subunit